MKKVVLVILIAAAGWWYFVGGRKLTEENVNGFYRDLEMATLERKPEKLCAFLSDNFESVGTVTVAGLSRKEEQNKAQTCEGYRKLYETFEKVGEKMGGIVQLDSDYTIHSIAISTDSKSATVDMSTSLNVAGSLMKIRSRSTDTLIRKNGKVLMRRSEGTGSIAGRGS